MIKITDRNWNPAHNPTEIGCILKVYGWRFNLCCCCCCLAFFLFFFLFCPFGFIILLVHSISFTVRHLYTDSELIGPYNQNWYGHKSWIEACLSFSPHGKITKTNQNSQQCKCATKTAEKRDLFRNKWKHNFKAFYVSRYFISHIRQNNNDEIDAHSKYSELWKLIRTISRKWVEPNSSVFILFSFGWLR